ncbi:hypothetical protein N473_21290 [Pseudoalteromonas luteoviolacea CPMOR-1]|uniref:Uncharacterized protein n=1 Tax=Pseudoalteromonas luteoviolacea CPMOR-1 TaxID=1365248 RepID=A0A167K3H5_9GAMM|nr:hypothetical protein N473_21290 [Pseudoalteromonas luteoviolacea CPMOR-1]
MTELKNERNISLEEGTHFIPVRDVYVIERLLSFES